MKFVQEEISIRTEKRSEMVDITDNVATLIGQTGITDGHLIAYCPHTTGAITINENADPDVIHDLLLTFDELFPKERRGYRHVEGNSDAHCKSSLVGASEQVLIQEGRLVLGTWQGLYFCEFDGPRTRRVILQISGEV
jgi:secondary thiamine-phosphate synthase enzyme